jgi:hypothetical protein
VIAMETGRATPGYQSARFWCRPTRLRLMGALSLTHRKPRGRSGLHSTPGLARLVPRRCTPGFHRDHRWIYPLPTLDSPLSKNKFGSFIDYREFQLIQEYNVELYFLGLYEIKNEIYEKKYHKFNHLKDLKIKLKHKRKELEIKKNENYENKYHKFNNLKYLKIKLKYINQLRCTVRGLFAMQYAARGLVAFARCRWRHAFDGGIFRVGFFWVWLNTHQ